MTATPEFSRPFPLSRLGTQPLRQRIEAGAGEREALARRFELVALDRLAALVEVTRQPGDRIELRADFEAEFVQSCIVSLEPVPGALAESFTLVYGPPESEEAATLVLPPDVAFEPLAGDTIDIGEAVAQEFSLALPPFPRSSNADLEAEPPQASDDGPFAALSQLLGRGRGEGR